MKRKNKPRQLSLAALSDDLRRFVGSRGWTLFFKPKEDGQLMAVSGTVDDVYKALDQWSKETPDYFSAEIFRPSGAPHRKIR